MRSAALTAVAVQSAWCAGLRLPDGHRLVRPLGTGGTAEVWEAAGPPGAVALKALWPDLAQRPEAVAAFAREARHGQALHHPGLVRTLGTGHDGVRPYIVLERLHGMPLPDAASASAPLPRRAVLRLLRRPAGALARMHEAGLVHGDVKPGNLFLETGSQLRLLDLGTARRPGDEPPPAGMPAATPRWTAPERLRGEPPDPRDDIYSLALVAAWLLGGRTGSPPPAGLRAALGPREGRPACPVRMLRGLLPWGGLWRG